MDEQDFVSDKYKIIAKINEGSYGKVYAAKCFKTNKIVALKAEIKQRQIFNTILEELKNDHGIDSESQVEKIIFFPKTAAPAFGGVDLDSLKNMDEASLMAKVQEMMSSMGPDQMADMKKMYDGMSEDEKAEIMKKGQDMGIVK